MEKERKGLFGQLLDFWKEKIGVGETDSIGFWNDTENVENHFAELGAVVSLTQGETRKAFWEENAEVMTETKQEEWNSVDEERKLFFVPEEELQEEIQENKEEADSAEQEKFRSRMFTAEVFRNEGREMEDTEASGLGKAFLWEMPEEEGEAVRGIIPVAEELPEEKVSEMEEEQEVQRTDIRERKEKMEEPTIDIEKLMRQITKKLWEDRESCGRRLR